MASTPRPTTHAHRDQIIRALAAYLASSIADPAVLELYMRFFASASAAYATARSEWLTAQAAWQAASAAADEADDAFDTALRRLMLSLRDEDGRADTALNQSLLGGVQPSELMAMRYAEEVTRARAFLTRLEARTDLSPNPDRLARFQSAVEALEAAAGASEAALRARLAAGQAQEQAIADFDSAWGKFVRAARLMVDEATVDRFVPRFGAAAESAGDEATAAEGAGG